VFLIKMFEHRIKHPQFIGKIAALLEQSIETGNSEFCEIKHVRACVA
jgi:hypothetical protein